MRRSVKVYPSFSIQQISNIFRFSDKIMIRHFSFLHVVARRIQHAPWALEGNTLTFEFEWHNIILNSENMGCGCDLYFYQNLKFFVIHISHVYYTKCFPIHVIRMCLCILIWFWVRGGSVVVLVSLEPGVVMWLELQKIHRFSQSRRRPLQGRTFSRLKSPTSVFTFKTLLRHYAKQVPKHSKLTWNWDADAIIIWDRRH